MRYFDRPVLAIVTRESVQLSLRFAQKVAPTCNYSDHNQQQLEKIVEDHFLGKLGEFAAVSALRPFVKVISSPDLSLRKSWDADLQVQGVPLAVKSCSSSSKFGVSWSFSADRLGRRDPILDRPESWICFVEILDVTPDLVRCLVYPPQQLKDVPFSDPDLVHLRGKKLVVRKSDLFVESVRNVQSVGVLTI